MNRIIIASLVVALIFFACKNEQKKLRLFNENASLPLNVNEKLSHLKLINSSSNKTEGTMSMLYGNELAANAMKESNGNIVSGEELIYVTWKQKDDENWFGGKIPDGIISVEMIKTTEKNIALYECLQGKGLNKKEDTLGDRNREKFIIGLKPSVLP